MKEIWLTIALIATSSAAAAAPIEGRWQNPKDSVIVNVRSCGAETYCGKVAWASAKAQRKAEGRMQVGTQILSGLRSDGRGGYKGRAYVPRHKVHATATVRHAGPDALIVKGCTFGGVICKSERWTRVN